MSHPHRLFRFHALAGSLLAVALLAGCGHSASDRMAPSQGHLMKATDPVATAPRGGQNIAKGGPAGLIPSAPMALPHSAEVYTITVTDMPVRDLLFALSRDANMNIDIYPGINGRVTLSAVNQTLPQILDRVSKQVDLRYEISGSTIVIAPDRPYLKIYQVNYLNMNRTTNSSIRISSQIATSEGADESNPLGKSENNQSVTTLTNQSTNKFWDSLTQNVQLILNQTPVQEESGVAGGGGGFEELELGGGAGLEKSRNGSSGGFSPVAAPYRPGIVAVNPDAGLLSVFASAAQHERIQQLLDQVLESAQRQVLIESTVVEVTLSEQYQEGVDWNNISFNPLHLESASGELVTNSVGSALSSLPIFSLKFSASNSNGSVDATLSALQQFGNVKVLSSPKIMALNNQTSILKVVENKVFFTLESSTAVTSSTSSSTTTSDTTATPLYNTKVHTVPVGLVMSVTPQISQDDIVTLNVRPTISSISDWEEDPNPGLKANNSLTGVEKDISSLVPVIQVKEMESMLRVQSGQVAVMGGLMQDKVQDKDTGVPGLADVPLVGKYLFNYEDDMVSKTELVIFIRPVVMTSGRPKIPGNMAMGIPGAPGGGWSNDTAAPAPSAGGNHATAGGKVSEAALPTAKSGEKAQTKSTASTPPAYLDFTKPAAAQKDKDKGKATTTAATSGVIIPPAPAVPTAPAAPAAAAATTHGTATTTHGTATTTHGTAATTHATPVTNGKAASTASANKGTAAKTPATTTTAPASEAIVPDDAAALDEASSTISLAGPEGKKSAAPH